MGSVDSFLQLTAGSARSALELYFEPLSKAVRATLGRRTSRDPGRDGSSLTALGDVLYVYWADGGIAVERPQSLSFGGPTIAGHLTIRGPRVAFDAQLVSVNKRGVAGFALIRYHGGVAYLLDSEDLKVESANPLPQGAYEVELHVRDKINQRGTVTIGPTHPPTWRLERPKVLPS